MRPVASRYWRRGAAARGKTSRREGERGREPCLVDAHVSALWHTTITVAGEQHDACDDGRYGNYCEHCKKNEHGETFRHEERVERARRCVVSVPSVHTP